MTENQLEIPTFKFAVAEGLDSSLYMPSRGEPTATGWDVRAASTLALKRFDHVKIPLGLRVLAPKGWWLELRPRSSSFAKKNLSALYGVIDETYEGQLMFACQYIPECDSEILGIQAGDAIGQLIPVRRQEMKTVNVSNEELDAAFKERNGIRGSGGFGSTSK